MSQSVYTPGKGSTTSRGSTSLNYHFNSALLSNQRLSVGGRSGDKENIITGIVSDLHYDLNSHIADQDISLDSTNPDDSVSDNSNIENEVTPSPSHKSSTTPIRPSLSNSSSVKQNSNTNKLISNKTPSRTSAQTPMKKLAPSHSQSVLQSGSKVQAFPIPSTLPPHTPVKSLSSSASRAHLSTSASRSHLPNLKTPSKTPIPTSIKKPTPASVATPGKSSLSNHIKSSQFNHTPGSKRLHSSQSSSNIGLAGSDRVEGSDRLDSIRDDPMSNGTLNNSTPCRRLSAFPTPTPSHRLSIHRPLQRQSMGTPHQTPISTGHNPHLPLNRQFSAADQSVGRGVGVSARKLSLNQLNVSTPRKVSLLNAFDNTMPYSQSTASLSLPLQSDLDIDMLSASGGASGLNDSMVSMSVASLASVTSEAPPPSSIQTIIRLRPTSQPSCMTVRDNTIAIALNDNTSSSNQITKYAYDYVLPVQSSQLDVFNTVGVRAVDAVFGGYNFTVLAYGQTASGKTHTIQGVEGGDGQDEGLIIRCARSIFDRVNRLNEASVDVESPSADDVENSMTEADDFSPSRTDTRSVYSVSVSYLEIYNELVFDLLSSSPSDKLTVRSLSDNSGFYAHGLTQRTVSSLEAMMEVVMEGNCSRRVSATLQNERSSRSHAILSMFVTKTDVLNGETAYTVSKLNLVDLAGSERYNQDKAHESVNINSSLSHLSAVINNLAKNHRKDSLSGSGAVGFRNSVLTKLLQDSLSGSSQTTLVACVHSNVDNRQETLSTLRFANNAKNIRVLPRKNDTKGSAKVHAELGVLRENNSRLMAHISVLQDKLQVLLREENDGAEDGVGHARNLASLASMEENVKALQMELVQLEKDRSRLEKRGQRQKDTLMYLGSQFHEIMKLLILKGMVASPAPQSLTHSSQPGSDGSVNTNSNTNSDTNSDTVSHSSNATSLLTSLPKPVPSSLDVTSCVSPSLTSSRPKGSRHSVGLGLGDEEDNDNISVPNSPVSVPPSSSTDGTTDVNDDATDGTTDVNDDATDSVTDTTDVNKTDDTNGDDTNGDNTNGDNTNGDNTNGDFLNQVKYLFSPSASTSTSQHSFFPSSPSHFHSRSSPAFPATLSELANVFTVLHRLLASYDNRSKKTLSLSSPQLTSLLSPSGPLSPILSPRRHKSDQSFPTSRLPASPSPSSSDSLSSHTLTHTLSDPQGHSHVDSNNLSVSEADRNSLPSLPVPQISASASSSAGEYDTPMKKRVTSTSTPFLSSLLSPRTHLNSSRPITRQERHYATQLIDVNTQLDRVRAQLDSMTAELSRKTEELSLKAEELDEKNTVLSDLTKAKDELDQVSDARQKEVERLELEINQFRTHLEENSGALGELQSEYDSVCQSYEAQLENIAAAHAKELSDLTDKHQLEVLVLEENYEEIHNSLVIDYDSRITNLTSQFDSDKAELLSSHTSDVDALKKTLANETSRLESERASAVADLVASQQEVVASLEAQHLLSLQTALEAAEIARLASVDEAVKGAVEEAVTETQTRTRAEVETEVKASLAEEYCAKLEATLHAHEKLISETQMKFDSDLAVLRSTAEEDLAQTTQTHEAQLLDLQSQHESTIAELNSLHEAKIAETILTLDQTVSSLNAEHFQLVESLHSDYSAQHVSLVQAHNTQIEELVAGHLSTYASMEEAAETRMTQALADYETRLAETTEFYETQLKVQEKERQAQEDELRAQLAALTESLTQTDAAASAHILSVEQDRDEEMSRLRESLDADLSAHTEMLTVEFNDRLAEREREWAEREREWLEKEREWVEKERLLKDTYEQQLQNSLTDLEEAKSLHFALEEKHLALKEEHSSSLSELKTSHQDTIDSLHTQHDTQLKTLESERDGLVEQHAQVVASLTDEHVHSTEALKILHSSAIEALTLKLTSEHQAYTDSAVEEAVEKAVENALKNAEVSHTTLIGELNAAHLIEMENFRREHVSVVDDLQMQMAAVRSDLTLSQKTCLDLEKSLSEVQTSLKSVENEKKSVEGRLADVEGDSDVRVKELRTEIEALSLQLVEATSSAEADLSLLNEQLLAAETLHSSHLLDHEAQVTALKETHERALTTLKETHERALEEAVEGVKTELTSQHSTELETLTTSHTSQTADLTASLTDKYEAEIALQLATIEELKTNLVSVQSDLNTCQADLTKYQEDMAKLTEDIACMTQTHKTELEKRDSDRVTVESELTELKTEREDLKRNVDLLTAELNSKLTQFQNLDQSNSTHESTIATLIKTNTTLAQANTSLTSQNDSLTKAHHSLTEELTDSRAQIAEYEAMLTETDSRLNALEAEYEALHLAHEELSVHSEQTHTQLSDTEASLEKVTSTLEIVRRHLTEAHSFQVLLGVAEERVVALQNLLRSLHLQVKNFTSQLSPLLPVHLDHIDSESKQNPSVDDVNENELETRIAEQLETIKSFKTSLLERLAHEKQSATEETRVSGELSAERLETSRLRDLLSDAQLSLASLSAKRNNLKQQVLLMARILHRADSDEFLDVDSDEEISEETVRHLYQPIYNQSVYNPHSHSDPVDYDAVPKSSTHMLHFYDYNAYSHLDFEHDGSLIPQSLSQPADSVSPSGAVPSSSLNSNSPSLPSPSPTASDPDLCCTNYNMVKSYNNNHSNLLLSPARPLIRSKAFVVEAGAGIDTSADLASLSDSSSHPSHPVFPSTSIYESNVLTPTTTVPVLPQPSLPPNNRSEGASHSQSDRVVSKPHVLTSIPRELSVISQNSYRPSAEESLQYRLNAQFVAEKNVRRELWHRHHNQ